MIDSAHEKLTHELCDPAKLLEYKKQSDGYAVSRFATLVGKILVAMGNIAYGAQPSLFKFKALEVVARIPYQSWEVATYTLLTGFYANEKKAIELSKREDFQRVAQDNETMHVVVISQLVKERGKNNIFLHTLVPIVFAFFYFWISYVLYFISRKSVLEINYVFETHAYEQYDLFLKNHEEALKSNSVNIDFLKFYGRHVNNEYELFCTIRNDELIHRHESYMRVK